MAVLSALMITIGIAGLSAFPATTFRFGVAIAVLVAGFGLFALVIVRFREQRSLRKSGRHE
jgi:hypothetical protein